MSKPKKAIILVAGRGERMRPLTDSLPKCLIEIKGKTILSNALEILEDNGMEEAILVVGYLKEQIQEAVGDKFGRMKITYCDNDIYNKTENSYSLWLAVKNLDEDLLILEGDIVFKKKLLREFLIGERENLTIVEKYNPHLDGTFVKIEEDGCISDWIHKKDRPQDFTLEDKYKTVNIHKFSKDFVEKWLKPILKKHPEEPIETVFSETIRRGGEIYAFETRDLKWIEIDDNNDLKRAQELFQ